MLDNAFHSTTMSAFSELGRWTVIAGIVLVALGGLLWLLGQIPGLEKFPGTWTWESDNVKIIAPIGVMILVSVILTIVLNIVVRLLR